MLWQQLTVRIVAEHVPIVESLLDAAGANAVSLGDAEDVPVLEPAPGETPLWPRVTVTALFGAETDLNGLASLLAAALPGDTQVAIAPLHETDWQTAGRGVTAPRRIGPRLWLAPAEGDIPEASTACVRLHMGHAFGTGEHPTTALCLEWIESSFEPGGTLLDYGCGSGVLALAARRLGASRAWAVDNDPQALAATQRNALLNDLDRNMWIGPPEQLPDVRVDLVLANILARPLIERAAPFYDALLPGGQVVLSGVLREQRPQLVEAYFPYFENFSVAERGEWMRIVGRRRAGAKQR